MTLAVCGVIRQILCTLFTVEKEENKNEIDINKNEKNENEGSGGIVMCGVILDLIKYILEINKKIEIESNSMELLSGNEVENEVVMRRNHSRKEEVEILTKSYTLLNSLFVYLPKKIIENLIINKSSENNDSSDNNDNNYNNCEDYINISLFTASSTILKNFESKNEFESYTKNGDEKGKEVVKEVEIDDNIFSCSEQSAMVYAQIINKVRHFTLFILFDFAVFYFL